MSPMQSLYQALKVDTLGVSTARSAQLLRIALANAVKDGAFTTPPIWKGEAPLLTVRVNTGTEIAVFTVTALGVLFDENNTD